MTTHDFADLFEDIPHDRLDKHVCHYHPESPAWGICGRCGKDLCRECFLACGSDSLCLQCRWSFLVILTRFKSYLFNPICSTILIIGLLSLVYFSVTRGTARVLQETSTQTAADKKNLVLRNWLYLGKGARLKLYADYLAQANKTKSAGRNYYKARLALEQALEGSQKEFGGKVTDKENKARLSGLLISIAACARAEGRTDKAVEALNKAVTVEYKSQMTGLACYRLGLIYEEDKQDYEQAISMYKASQARGVRTTDFLNSIIDSLLAPAREGRINSTVAQLAGSYNSAEAQSRVVGCYEALGLAKEVIKENQVLLEEYPFSEWAVETRERGKVAEPEKEETEPDFFESESDPEPPGPEKSKETLIITPLEE